MLSLVSPPPPVPWTQALIKTQEQLITKSLGNLFSNYFFLKSRVDNTNAKPTRGLKSRERIVAVSLDSPLFTAQFPADAQSIK